MGVSLFDAGNAIKRVFAISVSDVDIIAFKEEFVTNRNPPPASHFPREQFNGL